MQILIYSPNIKLGEPLARMFSQHGIFNTLTSDEERATFLAMTSPFAVILLVESIGRNEGLGSFHSNTKAEGCVSRFILLTQNQSTTRVTRLLAEGIDSCHILPYSYRELITEVFSFKQNQKPTYQSIRTNRFEVDLLARSILCDNVYIPLTPRCFALLAFFIQRKGLLLSRAQIWDEVWGDDQYPVNNTIEVFIRRIRIKLPEPMMIETVAGIGYRLRADC